VASTHLGKYSPTVIWRVLASFNGIYAKFCGVLSAQITIFSGKSLARMQTGYEFRGALKRKHGILY